MLEKRIDTIQSSFQAGKIEAERLGLISNFEFDKSIPNEYVSVAYEGFSMGIALKSIIEKQSLTDWQVFFDEHGQKHASQVYVGLGWALCQLNHPLEKILDSIDAKWKLRVLDGYGYCSALLKRRSTIRNQEIPANITAQFLSGFDQGVGRSLWYITKGDIDRLKRTIDLFPSERHLDLWRGIGIAVTFVGGIDSTEMHQLEIASGSRIKEFKLGVVMAQSSRVKAESQSESAQKIANYYIENESLFLEKLDVLNTISFADITGYLHELRQLA